MTHWRKIVSKDSPHLNSADIAGHTPLAVTISGHSEDGVRTEDGDTKTMLFVKFNGKKKSLGMNVTNCMIAEKVLGTPEIEEWVGKTIQLRIAKCRGEECIRLHGAAGIRFPKRVPKFEYLDKAPSGNGRVKAKQEQADTDADEPPMPDDSQAPADEAADDLPY